MNKDYIIETAETIRQQLLATTPINVICSWGAFNGFYAIVHNTMPALTFSVNGRLFQGDVIIAYNDCDCYEVYLKDSIGYRLVQDEVYFDMLGRVIDEAVETGTDEDAYQAFCEEERQKLMRGNLG